MTNVCVNVNQCLPSSLVQLKIPDEEKLPESEREAARRVRDIAPGYTFTNPQLALQALTHISFVSESPSLTVGDNERLEFLGDAVLLHLVAQEIFNDYLLAEGALSALRSFVCSNTNLTRVGRSLGIDACIRLSKAEVRNGAPTDAQVASAVEALIAAISIDGGIEKARTFVSRHILAHLPEWLKSQGLEVLNPKSALQEMAHQLGWPTPEYREIADAVYPAGSTVVAVLIQGREVARGAAETKRAASKEAARNGLKVLQNEK